MNLYWRQHGKFTDSFNQKQKGKEKAVNHQKLTSFPEVPTIVLYQSVANIILK